MRRKDNNSAEASLKVSLSHLIDMLNHYQEYQWSSYFQKILDYLAKNELVNGLEMLIGSYGGMGSFNDLVIHPANGHPLLQEEVGSVNEELNRLRNELYQQGLSLKHQLP